MTKQDTMLMKILFILKKNLNKFRRIGKKESSFLKLTTKKLDKWKVATNQKKQDTKETHKVN